jgi:hypothetical protein
VALGLDVGVELTATRGDLDGVGKGGGGCKDGSIHVYKSVKMGREHRWVGRRMEGALI